MKNADCAVEYYNSGCSCAQAVFTTYCEDFGIDKKLGLKVACPLGGGMGHTGGVCGAVTGALLVLGLKFGQDDMEDKYAKAMNYLIVQDYVSRFKKRNGSINCKELVNYDLSDVNQLTAARQTDVFKTKCPNYVADAVNLLEEVMAEYDSAKNEQEN